jgi:hypothetical protein
LIFKRDVIDDSKFPRGITIFADTPEIWISEIRFLTLVKTEDGELKIEEWFTDDHI